MSEIEWPKLDEFIASLEGRVPQAGIATLAEVIGCSLRTYEIETPPVDCIS